MKRIKQISIDVVVTEEQNISKLSEDIAETLENEGYEILRSDLSCDVTDSYEKYCPVLLKDNDNDIEIRIKEMLEEQAKEFECSVEEVKFILLQEWGKGANRGYRIATEPDMEQGLTVIERIDEYGVYDGDLEAGLQAEKDGVQLIPFEENPKVYPYDCYRILDTDVNRQIIKKVKEMEENNYEQKKKN